MRTISSLDARLKCATRRSEHYDAVVIGGGAAGVAAALGASRNGARTLIVERYGFLGGEAANANVLSYCGFYTAGETPELVVGGVGAQVLQELANLGFDTAPIHAPSGNWIVMLDPEAIKAAMDRLVAIRGLDVRAHCSLVAAHRPNDRIDAVTVVDAAGLLDIEAAAFIDASGDAVLGHAAGVPAIRDAEPDRGRQVASFPVRFGGVHPGVAIDKASLAALAPLCADTAGQGHASVRSNGGHFIRLPRSNDLWWMGIDVVTAGLDSVELAVAEAGARALAWRFLETARAQLPGFESAYIVATGPGIGIRDSRQLQMRYRLTDDDVLTGRLRDDGIACGSWPAEIHGGGRAPRFTPIGGARYYHVPLDALRPMEIDNLWAAGRTIGCDEAAYGSLRVMGTAFATGHAAGVAASLYASTGATPTAEGVRAELLRQDAILELDSAPRSRRANPPGDSR